MRYIDTTGRLLSVERLPRDEESDIGGVRLELTTRAGLLGDPVEVRATVDSFCDDDSAAHWLRVGELLDVGQPDAVPVQCHVSGLVQSSATDDGILHICVAGYGVSPDIGILALFPAAWEAP